MNEGNRLRRELGQIKDLAERLLEEPWDEYDRVLTEACGRLAAQSNKTLRTVAKAISKVTPEESRAVPGVDWVGDTLDEVT